VAKTPGEKAMPRSRQFRMETTSTPPEAPSRRRVWVMFDRIAHRYDFLNHFLSAYRDVAWRRHVAEMLGETGCLQALDLATGTADQLLALYDSGRVTSGVGLDLAQNMLAIGRTKIEARGLTEHLSVRTGDAEDIPFEDNSFDCVTISFGIRNVSDVEHALHEMLRVLRKGGRALILEFSLPANRIVRSVYLFYLRHVLPGLGRIIAGHPHAYRYLNETIETFPHGEQFCALMQRAGFSNVAAEPLTAGIVSVYRGDKS